jgi:hypothetical protein
VKLIRVGKRTLNLEYMVMDEEHDGSADMLQVPLGGLRVTMERGKEFILCRADAELFRRFVDSELLPLPELPSDQPGSFLGSAEVLPPECDDADDTGTPA